MREAIRQGIRSVAELRPDIAPTPRNHAAALVALRQAMTTTAVDFRRMGFVEDSLRVESLIIESLKIEPL